MLSNRFRTYRNASDQASCSVYPTSLAGCMRVILPRSPVKYRTDCFLCKRSSGLGFSIQAPLPKPDIVLYKKLDCCSDMLNGSQPRNFTGTCRQSSTAENTDVMKPCRTFMQPSKFSEVKSTQKREDKIGFVHEKISKCNKMCFSNPVYFTPCGIQK